MKRLKTLVSNPVDKLNEPNLPYVALEHIESQTGRLLPDVELKGKDADDSVAHVAGDVRFGKLRPYLAKSILADGPGVGSGELLVLRPGAEIESRYLWYLTLSRSFIEYANATSYGVKMPRTSWEALGNFRIDVPPIKTQLRLAEILDHEMGHIDSLISEQVYVDHLLEEARRAAVFEYTSGTNVPGNRRPGPHWTTSVPETWSVVKLTTVARLGSGHTPARNHPDLWENCTVPWITTGEVWQIRSDVQETITETREKISTAGVAESAAVVHPAGTVVLCRTAASAGYSAIMGLDMATSQDFATWTCGPDLLPDYLLYCLRAMRRDLLERLAMGSTHRTIYMPDIKSIAIPLPPIGEQRRLVAELRKRLATIDATRKELASQISLLREHRQALITAAVTGGLDAVKKVA